MPRTKTPKSEPAPQAPPQPTTVNGLPDDVLTLAEAAAYLKFSEDEVLRLVDDQGLPARRLANQWRFLKTAIQEWLRTPSPKYSKEAQLAVVGSLKRDPTLVPMVEEIYRRRGRPITEDGSYNLLHGLEAGQRPATLRR